MPTRPEVFVSAASLDLTSSRHMVRDILLTMGCVPVVQEHFPPGAGEVRAMLRERIAACHAIVHIAGECYGHEPRERNPAQPRRSYTQLEYGIALELKKPLYTFLCAPGFRYDDHDPEPAQLRELQEAHRAALIGGDHLYVPIQNQGDLAARMHELQTRVESISDELRKTRSWLSRGIVIILAALMLIAGVLYGVKHQAETRAVQAEAQLASLQLQLQQQSRLISLVSEKLDRGTLATDSAKSDPAAAARADAARQLGMNVEDLQKGLVGENGDVRVLLARIEQASASAEAKAAQWGALRRSALTKLGDAEQDAGHYAAMVEPYQQALALTDKQRDPRLWCDAAQNLVTGFYQMGRYPAAETLVRDLIAQRTVLQGSEHPDTLRSIRLLGCVLSSESDFAAAETKLRHCLEAQERVLGKDHPDTLQTGLDLAAVLNVKGDYAGAEALQRHGLEVKERTLGKEHPGTLKIIQELADTYFARGDYAGAVRLTRPCLEAQERVLGKDHPDTLKSVLNLAVMMDEAGDAAGAEPFYRRSLEAYERTLGAEHPITLMTISDLAQSLDGRGDSAAAEPLYLRAQAGMEHTLPPEYNARLDLDYYFSLMRRKQGRLAESLVLAEHAAAGAVKTLPVTAPLRITYEKNLQDLRAKMAAATPSP